MATIWHFGFSRNSRNISRGTLKVYVMNEYCIFRCELFSFYEKEKVPSLFHSVGFFGNIPPMMFSTESSASLLKSLQICYKETQAQKNFWKFSRNFQNSERFQRKDFDIFHFSGSDLEQV